jgi:hypothetical protein
MIIVLRTNSRTIKLAPIPKIWDNGGKLIFIDPSLVDDFWSDDSVVKRYFEDWGLDNITHYKMTTQEFKLSDVTSNALDLLNIFL